MIRRLYRRICAYFFDCRIDECPYRQGKSGLCFAHWRMWRNHIAANPVQPGDWAATDWSVREWVREINARRKERA